MILTRILLVLVAMSIAVPVLARDPTGQWANSSFHEWFLSQRQEPDPNYPKIPPASCCGDGDGHVLPDSDLKSIGGGKYMVRINGNWMLYPKPVDPTHENPTGKAWIWYTIRDDGDIVFYCLRMSIGM